MCMKPRSVEGMRLPRLIDLIDHVLISITDPQGHLCRCESEWECKPRSLVDIGLETVYDAIKIGYRLFDGACDYGNEKEAGEGVRRAIKDGLVKREDICGFSRYLGSGYCH